MPTPSKFRSLREDALSNSSTRSPSRVRTPNPDGEENGSLDVNFSSIEELLSSKLDSLQNLVHLRDTNVHADKDLKMRNATKGDFKQKTVKDLSHERIQNNITSINQIISSLNKGRNEVSTESREFLTAQLYKIIVSKPIVVFNEENAGTSEFVSESAVENLVYVFTTQNFRTESEFILLYRSIIAILSSNLEEFGGLVDAQLLGTIERYIQDQPNAIITNECKAGLITGYCSLLLVLYSGTSAYGVDAKVNWLFEIAQGYVESSNTLREQIESGDREYSTLLSGNHDKEIISEQESKAITESQIAIASIHGCGSLLTLLPRGEFLNEILNELLPKLVEIVDDEEHLDLSKAATRVISLSYEIYTYDTAEEDIENEDDEFNYNAPYYEQGELTAILQRLSGLGGKKVAKRDRAEVHSIFRETLNTIEVYTNADKRIEIYKKSPDGIELSNTLVSSTHVKLSKSKALPINSWFLYFRLLHLKWCFGFGLHDQLVSNNDIKQILREPPSEYQEKYNFDPNESSIESGGYRSANANSDAEYFADADKKRSNDLRKARINKTTEKLEDLNLLDEKKST